MAFQINLYNYHKLLNYYLRFYALVEQRYSTLFRLHACYITSCKLVRAGVIYLLINIDFLVFRDNIDTIDFTKNQLVLNRRYKIQY